MVWAVFTDTTRGPGFLAGDYVGASGEVTFAAGLGANVLVGGSNRTRGLAAALGAGDVGVNLALGVGDLSLRPAGADADVSDQTVGRISQRVRAKRGPMTSSA